MRNIVWVSLLVVSASGIASASIAPTHLDQVPADGIDMIVTGKTISTAHKARWHDARRLERECPQCGVDQPFPGDEQSR